MHSFLIQLGAQLFVSVYKILKNSSLSIFYISQRDTVAVLRPTASKCYHNCNWHPFHFACSNLLLCPQESRNRPREKVMYPVGGDAVLHPFFVQDRQYAGDIRATINIMEYTVESQFSSCYLVMHFGNALCVSLLILCICVYALFVLV